MELFTQTKINRLFFLIEDISKNIQLRLDLII